MKKQTSCIICGKPVGSDGACISKNDMTAVFCKEHGRTCMEHCKTCVYSKKCPICSKHLKIDIKN